MNTDKPKVAMVSRQDFERIKRKSAQLPTRETVRSVEIHKKNDHPPFHHVPRKTLPKTVKLTEKDQEIITRAELAKQEELEEVRRANRILLTAKCNLIRKEQIAEKNELGREHDHEELRYYKIMERERQEELLRVARETEERQTLNKEHAEMIKKQLELRANDRQKQADMIKAEADSLVVLEARLKASNEKAAKDKEMRRDKIKKDLQYAYEMNNRIKMSNFEKERNAEMKVQEYMRQRRAREEALELEKRTKNEHRERQMLRMCQEQMQISNSRDDKYEQWLHREAERKDREFRQKELDAALIRKKEFDVIMKDREMQQTEKVGTDYITIDKVPLNHSSSYRNASRSKRDCVSNESTK